MDPLGENLVAFGSLSDSGPHEFLTLILVHSCIQEFVQLVLRHSTLCEEMLLAVGLWMCLSLQILGWRFALEPQFSDRFKKKEILVCSAFSYCRHGHCQVLSMLALKPKSLPECFYYVCFLLSWFLTCFSVLIL